MEYGENRKDNTRIIMIKSHSHSHPIEKVDGVDGITRSNQQRLQDEFIQGVEQTKEETDDSALEEAIVAGLAVEAINQVTLQRLRENLDQTEEPITDIHREGEQNNLREMRQRGFSGLSIPDDNRFTRQFIQARVGNLVQGISQESQKAIQQAVTRGISNNLNTETIARQIRRSIGLTARQEVAVSNFRRMLQQQDKNAIGRFLSASERQQVRRIVRQGGTAQEINNLTDKYAQHQVNIRARSIARTETVRAKSMGKINHIRALHEQGDLDKNTLVKKWQINPPNVCQWCRNLNGTTVGIETTFRSSVPFETQPGVKTFSNIVPPLHTRCKCEIRIEER